jgi:DNA primase
MTDSEGNVVGIRLRAPNGRKWSVRGGQEGLFIPADETVAGERLLICEGPTDTAALLDLGFSAVGRPSCTGGVTLLAELVKHHRPAEVVIVADADAPGQRGAESLAAVLLAYSAAVRVIAPPSGVKDARAWKQAVATAADVLARIDAATIRKLTIKAERKGARS